MSQQHRHDLGKRPVEFTDENGKLAFIWRCKSCNQTWMQIAMFELTPPNV